MKTETLDLDLEEFDKELLIFLIKFAHERDITFNEAITEILKSALKEFDIQYAASTHNTNNPTSKQL